jgi:prepilin-type N-terminal cleavage/methylation domain-containing protein/prepilin-type processing-associated H-X9-DG protein
MNKREPEPKTCPRCGERFECRLSATCWCAEYPALEQTDPKSDCLCRKCLEKAHRLEKKGFTLVELLVVIAICAALAGLLLPVLTRSKESGKSTKCINNLRQFSLAAHMYWDDNNGQTFTYGGILTNSGEIYWFGWIGSGPEETRPFDPTQGVLYPYMGTGVDLCPSFAYGSSEFKLKASVPTCDYGYNLALSPLLQATVNIKNVRQPSALALLADAAQVNTFEAPASVSHPMFEEWYYINEDPSEPNGQFRHDQRANVTFCDGHITPQIMVPGTLDQRLPDQRIGWLPAAILTATN